MANLDKENEMVRCSFCRKAQDQVTKVIAGPDRVYLCNECVGLCLEIIDGTLNDPAPQDAEVGESPTPTWRAYSSANPAPIPTRFRMLQRQLTAITEQFAVLAELMETENEG
jgi:ClpX C4-type zinc finger